MKTLSVFLEGLLNKSNKTNIIFSEDVLINAMTKDWQDVLGRYITSPMPTWMVEIDDDDNVSVFNRNGDGKNIPTTFPVGSNVLAALKTIKAKKVTAHAFALGDWKTRNTIKELNNIILHSTNPYPAVTAFNFKGNWELENVTLRSDRDAYAADYYDCDRSLIIGKNVKLENNSIDIHNMGDTETLGYDYSEVTTFKCNMPYRNPLSAQIIEWLEQKKEGVAKDEDLKKLIGDVPPIAKSYNYVIAQDSTWNIHMKIYNDSMMKFNRDTSWDWNGLHIQAYRQRGAKGQIFRFMDDPDIPVHSKHKIKR